VVLAWPVCIWWLVTAVGTNPQVTVVVGLLLLFAADKLFKFQALLPIMTPVLLIGGMSTGVFTPTEGAIAACVWALILGFVWYRTLNFKLFLKICLDTVETTATVLFIVAAASIFGWLLTSTGVTASMGADNSEIILTDSTGKNIEITNYTAADSGAAAEAEMDVTGLNTDGTPDATADTLTLDNTDNDATVTGQVTFTSTQTFSVNSAEIDAGANEVGFFSDTANAADLESVADIDLSSAESSAEAITVIDVALQKISQARGNLGAMSNRLDSTISNLTNISGSVQAAKSQVMDADFAAESTQLARGQILSQAATAMANARRYAEEGRRGFTARVSSRPTASKPASNING
jgi:hypothetical protein